MLLKRSVTSKLQLTLVDEFSLMACVKPGFTNIFLSKKNELAKGCGLIPIGESVSNIKTEGLMWDLTEDMELSMYGLISTSNEVVGEFVKIKTDRPLVWCTSFSSE